MLSGGLAIAMRHVDLMLNVSKYESINWHSESVWMPFKVLPTKRGEKLDQLVVRVQAFKEPGSGIPWESDWKSEGSKLTGSGMLYFWSRFWRTLSCRLASIIFCPLTYWGRSFFTKSYISVVLWLMVT